MLSSTLLLSLLTTPASACGGLFCDAKQPVVQAAERIVFGIERDGTVEMHVQITYEGPSEEFAWIVPVPAKPDLFLTTSALFTSLPQQSQPTFRLDTVFEGQCRFPPAIDMNDGGASDDTASVAPIDYSSSTAYDVNVLREEVVGPYETVVLEAASAADLTGWLSRNAYDLPDGLDAVLKPYIASGSAFVALKLAKDRDAGDMAPLALRYGGDVAAIPVQLTSVAATPDMRLEAYVLGNGRAVPESYFHVEINDAAIDWWTGGSNYADVITQAADEAGAHAFATDFAGSTDRWSTTFDVGDYDRKTVVTQTEPVTWMFAALRSLGTRPAELDQVVEAHVPLPEGVTGNQFVRCPDCWGNLDGAFDPVAATDALELFVIEPSAAAHDLLNRHPVITRMTSSLSPLEMSIDPTFVINQSLPTEVSENRSARIVYECNSRTLTEDARRRLELADGRVLLLPSMSYLNGLGISDFAYLAEHGADAAMKIERTSRQGAPETVTDHLPRLEQLAAAHNERVRELLASSCGGCSSSGGAGAGVLGLGLLLAVARRRR